MHLHTIRRPLSCLAVVLLVVGVGCAQTQQNKSNDRFQLKRTVLGFHRDMRWNEFEKAAETVTESHRQEFLGRYEEYGEAFDIVNLEVETIENLDANRRKISVEQKWLREPDMTVKDDTYIEIWKRVGNLWKLDDRMKEEKWERRQQLDARTESEADSTTEIDSTDSK